LRLVSEIIPYGYAVGGVRFGELALEVVRDASGERVGVYVYAFATVYRVIVKPGMAERSE
jgi:hypothetical protein